MTVQKMFYHKFSFGNISSSTYCLEHFEKQHKLFSVQKTLMTLSFCTEEQLTEEELSIIPLICFVHNYNVNSGQNVFYRTYEHVFSFKTMEERIVSQEHIFHEFKHINSIKRTETSLGYEISFITKTRCSYKKLETLVNKYGCKSYSINRDIEQ